MTESQLAVRLLGRIDFDAAFELQETLLQERLADAIPDTLLLLEHPPTITLGRRGSHDDIYASAAALDGAGIVVRETNRGGLVTYHGPGQIVGYLIARLTEIAGTAPALVSGLEDLLVRVLAEYGIAAFCRPRHRGVFTSQGKIAAIGIGVRRGITMHGFALNVQPNMSHFALINPCGIGELGVTSMEREMGTMPDQAAVYDALAFRAVTELSLERIAEAGVHIITPG